MADMLDVEVIADPAAAVSALDPIRSRLLAELTEPASAAALASRVGIARQKVNYHLRALEDHQLVTEAGERQWGGLKERLLVATAASYVVSPGALGPVAADPGRSNDRLSASYLIALAARAVREVGEMWAVARDEEQAAGDLVHRRRHSIPISCRPGRVHPRTLRGGHVVGRPLSRRI